MKRIIEMIPLQTKNILIFLVLLSTCMWVIGPANKVLNIMSILGSFLLVISINSHISSHFKKEREKRKIGIQQKESLFKYSKAAMLLFIILAVGCLASTIWSIGYLIDPFRSNNNLMLVFTSQIIFSVLIIPASKLGEYLGKKIVY